MTEVTFSARKYDVHSGSGTDKDSEWSRRRAICFRAKSQNRGGAAVAYWWPDETLSLIWRHFVAKQVKSQQEKSISYGDTQNFTDQRELVTTSSQQRSW